MPPTAQAIARVTRTGMLRRDAPSARRPTNAPSNMAPAASARVVGTINADADGQMEPSISAPTRAERVQAGTPQQAGGGLTPAQHQTKCLESSRPTLEDPSSLRHRDQADPHPKGNDRCKKDLGPADGTYFREPSDRSQPVHLQLGGSAVADVLHEIARAKIPVLPDPADDPRRAWDQASLDTSEDGGRHGGRTPGKHKAECGRGVPAISIAGTREIAQTTSLAKAR